MTPTMFLEAIRGTPTEREQIEGALWADQIDRQFSPSDRALIERRRAELTKEKLK